MIDSGGVCESESSSSFLPLTPRTCLRFVSV